MMQDIFMAGFGGQGILLAGNLLAYTAIEADLNASFFPAYGVEKRGGAANCTVVLSNGDVGSPVVGNPSTLLAFNPLSFFPSTAASKSPTSATRPPRRVLPLLPHPSTVVAW